MTGRGDSIANGPDMYNGPAGPVTDPLFAAIYAARHSIWEHLEPRPVTGG